MRKFLLLATMLFSLVTIMNAQVQRIPVCDMPQSRLKNDEYLNEIKRFILDHPRPIPGQSYTIPVVFHV